MSITGIMDHPFLAGEGCLVDGACLEEWLMELRDVVIRTNKEWAKRLGINPATAATCIKPSGTVSQLVNSSSGIHPRFSPYYIRRVRGDKRDPLSILMQEQGVPYEMDITNNSAIVFSFPQKAPDFSPCTKNVSAMDQLWLWDVYQNYWCEHKPSCTIYYSDDEFLEIGSWLYKNFDSVSGISFLPRTDHIYKQAPYEAISEEMYNALVGKMPEINWSLLGSYEQDDMTVGQQTLACSAGNCEL